jgi:hypothetical protein
MLPWFGQPDKRRALRAIRGLDFCGDAAVICPSGWLPDFLSSP